MNEDKARQEKAEYKARLYAQYIEQDVLIINAGLIGASKPQKLTPSMYSMVVYDTVYENHLSLKDLATISDEDAIEVCCYDEKIKEGFEVVRIIRYSNYIAVEFKWKEIKYASNRGFGYSANGISFTPEHLTVREYQILQSKGYALPFLGKSVAEQIQEQLIIIR